MKTLRQLTVLFVFIMIASCGKNREKDDTELLKKVLHVYFDAINNKDLDKMNSVTTQDFILIEGGKFGIMIA